MARRVAHLDEKTVFAMTVYLEARGEPKQGQEWVAWVIKNRAAQPDKKYWFCDKIDEKEKIKAVCLKSGQFECWNDGKDISIKEQEAYKRIRQLTDQVYGASDSDDPTGGADHYNNPDIEDSPSWTQNCERLRKIENHQFYKGR